MGPKILKVTFTREITSEGNEFQPFYCHTLHVFETVLHRVKSLGDLYTSKFISATLSISRIFVIYSNIQEENYDCSFL